jgi:arabinose-5-phosphate isomerase
MESHPAAARPASADRDECGFVREAMLAEADAVRRAADRVAGEDAARWSEAVGMLDACTGHVVVCGMGKSGLVGAKIAATMSSLGLPAHFMHPSEALHGDLGRVRAGDVAVLISYSGGTEELVNLAAILRTDGIRRVGISCNHGTHLARLSDVHLAIGDVVEACPLNLAPTASTTATLAMGDALAIACLDARGFGAADFARSHPGGALGRRLLTRVTDVMRTGDALPTVPLSASVLEAVAEIGRKRLGMTAVLDEQGAVAGIFTEGDLRRLIERVGDVRSVALRDVITAAPLSVPSSMLAAEAARILDASLRNQLLVIDDGKLVGALHMHDLSAAKVL